MKLIREIYRITLGIWRSFLWFQPELDSELTSPEIKKNNPPPFTSKISPYPPEIQGGGGYSSWEQGGGGSSSWDTYPNPAPHP